MARKRMIWIGSVAVMALAGGGWWLLTPSPPLLPEAASAAEPPATPAKLPLSAEQQRRLGLSWAIAQTATEAPLAALPATIVPPVNDRVAVAALFPGVVERSFVVEGDPVRRGQTLAIVRSAEILSLHADVAKSQARLDLAHTSARRLDQLAREGVIAGARADEAAATLREARADAGEKRRILALSGGSGSNGSYALTAPIAGRVTVASARPGDRLDGTSAPFVIDAAAALEANAQLPERMAGQVRPGMTVRLGDTRGQVTAVGATVDPQTRSILLKARLPAAPGVIAGGSVNLTLLGPAPPGAVSIPAGALVNIRGADSVFAHVPGGVAIRPVRVGERSGDSVLVLSGLTAGERVVATGTSELKALAQAR